MEHRQHSAPDLRVAVIDDTWGVWRMGPGRSDTMLHVASLESLTPEFRALAAAHGIYAFWAERRLTADEQAQFADGLDIPYRLD